MVFTQPSAAHAPGPRWALCSPPRMWVHSWACQAARVPQHQDTSAMMQGVLRGSEGQARGSAWGLRAT